MDVGDKDQFRREKKNDDPYMSPTISDWRFDGANLSTTSMGLVSVDNAMSLSRENLIGSSCPSTSITCSFGQTLWGNPTHSQNQGFQNVNMQINSNATEARNASHQAFRSGIDETLNMEWSQHNSILRGGGFLPNMQTLSQLPADSAFIERAARFSCFSDIINPLGYSRGGAMIQGPQEVFSGGGLQSISCIKSQKNETNNVGEDTSLTVNHGDIDGSPLKHDRKSASLVRSLDESKHGATLSGNDSGEAEFSGQDELSLEVQGASEASAKGIKARKRKRNVQDTEVNQGVQQNPETEKSDSEFYERGQKVTLVSGKTAGKNDKQGSQTSDLPKEDYIHIRARRGQATNSHSLAERVRREKISERMKFLQDLVPGCSKVTGKAVMLDEIINYVQSLQRQVEFLSMKLATVNPRLDFNIEGLLAKDLLQSRDGLSSALGCSIDMHTSYPTPYPPQGGLIQSSFHSIGSPSNILRRSINSQSTSMTGTLKENTQLPSEWNDELHNVVQMGFGTNSLSQNEDLNGSLSSSHMKVEL